MELLFLLARQVSTVFSRAFIPVWINLAAQSSDQKYGHYSKESSLHSSKCYHEMRIIAEWTWAIKKNLQWEQIWRFFGWRSIQTVVMGWENIQQQTIKTMSKKRKSETWRENFTNAIWRDTHLTWLPTVLRKGRREMPKHRIEEKVCSLEVFRVKCACPLFNVKQKPEC